MRKQIKALVCGGDGRGDGVSVLMAAVQQQDADMVSFLFKHNHNIIILLSD